METVTGTKDGILRKSEVQIFKSQKLSDFGGFQPPEVRKKPRSKDHQLSILWFSVCSQNIER